MKAGELVTLVGRPPGRWDEVPQVSDLEAEPAADVVGPDPLPDRLMQAGPDGANRLFTLVENQSAHRQTLEAKIVADQMALSRRGQTFAFVLAIAFGAAGVTL